LVGITTWAGHPEEEVDPMASCKRNKDQIKKIRGACGHGNLKIERN